MKSSTEFKSFPLVWELDKKVFGDAFIHLWPANREGQAGFRTSVSVRQSGGRHLPGPPWQASNPPGSLPSQHAANSLDKRISSTMFFVLLLITTLTHKFCVFCQLAALAFATKHSIPDEVFSTFHFNSASHSALTSGLFRNCSCLFPKVERVGGGALWFHNEA